MKTDKNESYQYRYKGIHGKEWLGYTSSMTDEEFEQFKTGKSFFDSFIYEKDLSTRSSKEISNSSEIDEF